MGFIIKCLLILTLSELSYNAHAQELSTATDVIPCVVIVRRCQSNCTNAPFDIVRWSFHILEGSVACEKIDGRSPQAVNYVPDPNPIITSFDVKCCEEDENISERIPIFTPTGNTPAPPTDPLVHAPAIINGVIRGVDGTFMGFGKQIHELYVISVATLATVAASCFIFLVSTLVCIKRKSSKNTKTECRFREKNRHQKDNFKTSTILTSSDSSSENKSDYYATNNRRGRSENPQLATDEFTTHRFFSSDYNPHRNTQNFEIKKITPPTNPHPTTTNVTTESYVGMAPMPTRQSSATINQSGAAVEDNYVEAPPIKSLRRKIDVSEQYLYNNVKPNNVASSDESQPYNVFVRSTSRSKDEFQNLSFPLSGEIAAV